MAERKTIERALQRRAGASAETRAKLDAAANSWDDWRGQCVCGFVRRGSLADLMKPCPNCGKVHGTARH